MDIMDDEKYFCFDGDSMPGNARYCTNGNLEKKNILRKS